jgi:hypothetical protein
MQDMILMLPNSPYPQWTPERWPPIQPTWQRGIKKVEKEMQEAREKREKQERKEARKLMVEQHKKNENPDSKKARMG